MLTDSNGDSRPSVSDIVNHKSKTEVKNKLPQSSEHKPFSERLLDIRDKITSILNKRELSNQTPPQTLQELSAIEVPQDTENPEPVIDQSPETSLETKPIIHDTTQQDQQQAKELAQHTKTEAAKLTEPVVEAPIREPLPLLYTDGPTLYDKYSKAYTKEKRSLFGALSRRADVRQLKKAGIKDAAKVYDALRSRGIPGSSIVREINENTRSRSFEFYDRKTLTPAEKSDLLQKAPAIIDRLDSVGCYGDFSLESLSTDQLILNLEDTQQFQQRRQQIQPLFFLDRSTIVNYLSEKNPDPKVDLFIKYLTSDFINNPDNPKDSFDSINGKVNLILSQTYTNNTIEEFINNTVYSDLNQNQPIKIPEKLISQLDYPSRYLLCLNNLSNRDQQKFILENYRKRLSYSTDQTGRSMFNDDNIPNINFYRQFSLSETNQGRKITIPQETLNLIDDPAQKTFYRNVSNLDSPYLQKVCVDSSYQSTIPDYFSETGQPNANLLINYYLDNQIKIFSGELPYISENQYAQLSLIDQKKLKVTEYILDLNQKFGLSNNELFHSLIDVHHPLDSYLESDNQPNSLFFKKILGSYTVSAFNVDQTQYLLDLVSQKLGSFPDTEKQFWTNILSLKELNGAMVGKIIRLSDQLPPGSLFNDQGQPTINLFDFILGDSHTFNADFLTSNLNPDVIASFPPDKQTFWKGISHLKNINFDQLQFISKSTMYEGKIDGFFDQNGQAKLHLFEVLTEGGFFQLEFFNSNLTSEVLASFPTEIQQYWKNILKLNYVSPEMAQAIFRSSKDSDFLFNQDGTPKSILFEKILEKRYYKQEVFRTNLTPEIMSSFTPEDQKFWNTVLTFSDPFYVQVLFENKNDYLSLLTDKLSINPLFIKKYIAIFPKSAPPLEQNFLDTRPETEQKFWQNIKKFGFLGYGKNPILYDLISDTGEISYDHPFYKIFSQDNPTFFSQDPTFSKEIGKAIIMSGLDPGDIHFSEINRLEELISSNPDIQLDENNWQSMLITYIQIQTGNFVVTPNVSEITEKKINEIFTDPSTKNFCLKQMQSEWATYLKSGKPESMSSSIYLISKFVNLTEGAGPLSQIDSLSKLINSVSHVLEAPTTASRTKTEIFDGISALESRFNREKWSNEDKTNFYNISTDIINAAPSLFSDYLTLFRKFTPGDLKRFSEEIYPLYKTELVLLEQKASGTSKYKIRDLVGLRQRVRGFTNFENQREELLADIRENFKDRFGLISIPESFSKEGVRSVKDISLYLGNLASKNPNREAILSYYLSLMVRDQWNDFRSGESFDPAANLSPEKSSAITPILNERQNIVDTIATSAGIDSTDAPEFIRTLQQESQTIHLGDTQTIDIKLNNIVRSLEELQDLDLYPDTIDKARVKLLQDWGNKKVGSVVARLYQQTANPSRAFTFSEEDLQIKTEIERICQENGLNINDSETIKSVFQDGLKQFSVIANISSTIKDLGVDSEIEQLRQKLNPPPEIVSLFDQLGEKFVTNSGVIPVVQDVDYLQNLIVKNEAVITPEDKQLASDYIHSVRSQIIKLEEIYDQIKSKFQNLREGSGSTRNELLTKKIDEITKIINQSAIQQPIVSIATNNLNDIIENMRECLSCSNKGANNDTNLTFGDVNKFYLYSKTSASSEGSISDQIAYLEPITRSDGSTEISFVIDNLYGFRSPTILEGHINTLLKKIDQIKTKFPKSKVSIFVSEAALTSSGTPTSSLIKKYQDSGFIVSEEEVDANFLKSSFGDHYVEVTGGNVRDPGIKKVKGIILNR